MRPYPHQTSGNFIPYPVTPLQRQNHHNIVTYNSPLHVYHVHVHVILYNYSKDYAMMPLTVTLV